MSPTLWAPAADHSGFASALLQPVKDLGCTVRWPQVGKSRRSEDVAEHSDRVVWFARRNSAGKFVVDMRRVA